MDLDRLTWALGAYRAGSERVQYTMYDHSPTGRLIDTGWRIVMQTTGKWAAIRAFAVQLGEFDCADEARLYAEVTYGLQ